MGLMGKIIDHLRSPPECVTRVELLVLDMHNGMHTRIRSSEQLEFLDDHGRCSTTPIADSGDSLLALLQRVNKRHHNTAARRADRLCLVS